MTVEELLNELNDVDPNAQIRLAQQPQWPFEYELKGVYVIEADELNRGDDEDNDDPNPISNEEDAPAEPQIVYLVEGSQLRYLPRAVSRAIGWK